VSAVKRRIRCFLAAWMFLQGSVQAQSGPGVTRSDASNEIPSFLVGALPSQPRIAGQPIRPAPAQQFVCNESFTLEQCKQEMLVLRKALANYRAYDLGAWTWVLVRSEDWKVILLASRLSPGVPALTLVGARTTFFEEALVAGSSGRLSELKDIWHLDRQTLLDLAIRHELGHALCNDANERMAERVARLLEQRKPVSCKAKADAKQKSR
jgi:hypothetical protein